MKSRTRGLAILLLLSGCSIAPSGTGLDGQGTAGVPAVTSTERTDKFVSLRSCSPLPGRAADPTDSPCERLAEANAAYERGDVDDALAKWREIISSDDDGPAWYAAVTNCGGALYVSKRYEDAIPVLKLLIENDAAVRESYEKGPIGQGFGGRAAESDLDSYLYMHAPDWHHACLKLSQCYEALDDLDAAYRYAVLSRDACRSPSFCGVPWASMQMATTDRIEELEKARSARSGAR